MHVITNYAVIKVNILLHRRSLITRPLWIQRQTLQLQLMKSIDIRKVEPCPQEVNLIIITIITITIMWPLKENLEIGTVTEA